MGSGKKIRKDFVATCDKGMRNDDVIAQSFGIGKDTLHRYIRLTYLISELLEMVDDGRIALTPAVELSYLTEQEQHLLLNEIEYADATPSLSQAQRLRDFSRQGRLNSDVIFAVMSEEKANQKEQIRFPKEEIRSIFPKAILSPGNPNIPKRANSR
ncbi:MAG: hypothetical protein ACLTE2_03900 [Eubacteriales bacterium]